MLPVMHAETNDRYGRCPTRVSHCGHVIFGTGTISCLGDCTVPGDARNSYFLDSVRASEGCCAEVAFKSESCEVSASFFCQEGDFRPRRARFIATEL